MALAETAFGLRTDEQQAAVVVEETLVGEVAQDGLGGSVERLEAVPLAVPQLVTELVLLQGDGEELLGHEVTWIGRGDDRFDPAARPQQKQPGRLQQCVVPGGEEEAVARRARAPAGAADALQEGGDGGR